MIDSFSTATISRRRASTDARIFRRIGREMIEVQLDRIGFGPLKKPRVLQPPLRRRAVDRRDDRHRDAGLDTSKLLEILIWTERKSRRAEPLVKNLLFEERPHDDGRGAGILELPHRVERVGQRRCTRHEGVFELESEIPCRQIHRCSALSATSRTSRELAMCVPCTIKDCCAELLNFECSGNKRRGAARTFSQWWEKIRGRPVRLAYSPMAAINPSMPTRPIVTPHAASVGDECAKLSGNSSWTTRKIIAPPANPRLAGSSG